MSGARGGGHSGDGASFRRPEELAGRYAPIGDYAIIGDCHGAALVSRGGSVDWCCLGRFDADPIFCRILDADRGGYLSVRPAGEYEVRRCYLPGTTVLETTFEAEDGRARVLDFMPVGRQEGSGVHDYVTLAAPFWLVRILEGVEGELPLLAEYRPSVDFARRRADLRATAGGERVEAAGPGGPACRGIDVPGGPCLHGELSWHIDGDTARAEVVLEPGERRHLVVSASPVPDEGLGERLEESLRITRAFWEEWSEYGRYDGPYREAVERSALTLKLLTYAPTGAIVAAATTSLPEEPGGERNWDYRFCWLRDAAFTLYSLAALGYGGEADDFSEFLLRACAENEHLQVLYGVLGERDLEERLLEHLEGWRGSRPVRIGNDAADQRQLDIFGAVLDWAHLFAELGERFDARGRAFLRRLAATVVRTWREPGQGIWETRSEPRQFVFGKIQAWVALDRALRLLERAPEADATDGADEAETWTRVRDEIRREVLERGVDPDRGHLRQAYEEEGPDGALLIVPLLGFPLPREVFERTVEVVDERLRSGDYVYRYLSADGLRGEEGAFLVCSFWLVDALLALDRGDEARRLFERLLGCANDLGLYAEEIDPRSGELLGNFPQAFTHLAVIQTAVNLELYEEHGAEVMWGSHASRARLGVEATRGWRAVWAAFRKTGRVGRIFSSRESIMPEEWMAASAPPDWRRAARGPSGLPRVILSPFAVSASDRERRRRAHDEEAARPPGPTV